VVAPAAGGGTAALRTDSTSLGTVTTDSRGRTVYELVGDPASNTKCSSACETIWPAVTSNGKIMTLHGHPLFTFTGDSAAGQTHGQGLKDTWGTWFAIDSMGVPITSTTSSMPSATASAPASSGGGYGY
jgi:predicted lipoprotein with Yx(FWY)xxD motif